MSFNPHEILFRLRSQQQNTNSNASSSQEPRQGNHLQQNKFGIANNHSNTNNSNQRLDSHNFESKGDPFPQQQQLPQQQQYQQNAFNQASYNNFQLNGQPNQRNQFVSIGNNISNNPKNNTRTSAHNSNSIESLKQRTPTSHQFGVQQPQQFITNPAQDNDQIQLQGGDKAAADPNNNTIVDYLLNKVNILENYVLEHQQKTGQVKPQVSPQRRVKTEVMYDEVAEVISKEPVDKILQKKEKNFVPFASKNSKRYSQPKVAGKLNLEQLQKIMNDYPTLSKPIINIKISEEDLN